MSELRIGCWGASILAGIYCHAVRLHWINQQPEKMGALIAILIIGFVSAVAFFGKPKATGEKA